MDLKDKSDKNKLEDISSIKLVKDIINQDKSNINFYTDEYEQNYKTEYKIVPEMNENIKKLDPMLILGVTGIIGLLIYLGYKYSVDSDDKIEM